MARKSPRRIGAIGTIFLVLLIFSVILNIRFAFRNFSGAVVSLVYDGDSFELSDGTRVRLMGVDAPEEGRCGYAEAKNELTRIALGRHVRLKHVVTDNYGRQVADVITEDFPAWISYMRYWIPRYLFGNTAIPLPDPDPMINRAMARSGWVRVVSASGQYKDTIGEGARIAKSMNLGIYSDQCRSPSPPSGCTIKGNNQQEGKFFFPSGCKFYSQVIVDRSFGDDWFCSEADAIAAGFSLAPSCR